MIVNVALALALLALCNSMVANARTCSSMTVTPCAVRANRHILFLVDASDSMDPARFQREMLDYTQSLYCAFNPADVNQAGMITFASQIATQIPLAQYTPTQWFQQVEDVRAKQLCCSCCTPTATAFQLAKTMFDAVPIGNAYRIVFTITDGAPWQNENGPFAWPGIPSATYTWGTVPQQARLLKDMVPDDPTRVRVMMIGVPNKDNVAPREEYFRGEPDPTKRPAGKAATWQCQTRGGKSTCYNMLNPPFPIVSTPINKNIFSAQNWDVQSLIDLTVGSMCEILATPAPTFAPTTFSPTKQPTTPGPTTPGPTTPPPTKPPTMAPTRPPTNQPTQSPTKKPTFAPTFAPTQMPTQSPVKPELDGLDMYFLLDRSRSMRWVPSLCRSAPGGNPSDDDTVACWRLFTKFVGQITTKLTQIPYHSQKLGWKDASPDIKRGLRVWIYAFACAGHQKEPIAITIGEKVGNQAAFDAAIARADALLPDGGTCPGAVIERAAAAIQGNDVLTRIYKSAILFTDGVFYDMPRPRLAARGLFHFGTLTYAMGIAIPSEGQDWGLKPAEIKRQRTQLMNFVQNKEERMFNFGSEGLMLLEEIAQEVADQLPRDAVANLPNISKVPYYCGWTSISRCTEMNSTLTATGEYCFWNYDMKACLPKNWCLWSSKGLCNNDPPCVWKAGKCGARNPV